MVSRLSCAVGLVPLLCEHCGKSFEKNCGSFSETSTGRQYDWSEGGVFDFNDSLFISSLLLQFVLPIARIHTYHNNNYHCCTVLLLLDQSRQQQLVYIYSTYHTPNKEIVMGRC